MISVMTLSLPYVGAQSSPIQKVIDGQQFLQPFFPHPLTNSYHALALTFSLHGIISAKRWSLEHPKPKSHSLAEVIVHVCFSDSTPVQTPFGLAHLRLWNPTPTQCATEPRLPASLALPSSPWLPGGLLVLLLPVRSPTTRVPRTSRRSSKGARILPRLQHPLHRWHLRRTVRLCQLCRALGRAHRQTERCRLLSRLLIRPRTPESLRMKQGPPHSLQRENKKMSHVARAHHHLGCRVSGKAST